jgi:hypothetical protein
MELNVIVMDCLALLGIFGIWGFCMKIRMEGFFIFWNSPVLSIFAVILEILVFLIVEFFAGIIRFWIVDAADDFLLKSWFKNAQWKRIIEMNKLFIWKMCSIKNCP